MTNTKGPRKYDSGSRMLKVTKIINEPGMTWKVRRALLRALGLSDLTIETLVPEPPDGFDFHPGDY